MLMLSTSRKTQRGNPSSVQGVYAPLGEDRVDGVCVGGSGHDLRSPVPDEIEHGEDERKDAEPLAAGAAHNLKVLGGLALGLAVLLVPRAIPDLCMVHTHL